MYEHRWDSKYSGQSVVRMRCLNILKQGNRMRQVHLKKLDLNVVTRASGCILVRQMELAGGRWIALAIFRHFIVPKSSLTYLYLSEQGCPIFS